MLLKSPHHFSKFSSDCATRKRRSRDSIQHSRRRQLFLESLEDRRVLSADFGAVFELSSLLPANGGDGTEGVIFNGLNPGDSVGFSVSGAGDINADGVDDIVLGAFGANSQVGSTYVIFGGSDPFAPSFDLSSLDGSNGFQFSGGTGNNVGFAVDSAGDVNADGIDDLLIGAPNGGEFASAYVIFGHAGPFDAFIDLSSLDGTNGFAVNGNAGDSLGSSVAFAGDVNNDGVEDILLGAPTGNGGEGYIVFGHPGPFDPSISVSSLDGTNGFAVSGGVSDFFGYSVSGLGDIDGDDIDDFVIGAIGANDNAGAGYVVFGHGDTFAASLDVSNLDGTNGFVFNGQPSDLAGYAVSSAGDVNGDSINDLLIGALLANESAGAAHVVFGHAGAFPAAMDASYLNGITGFTVNGNAQDLLAWSVSAGDFNGDGIDDLLVGAFSANGFTGAAYVVFGHSGPFAETLDVAVLDGSNGFTIHGISAGDSVGSAADGRGDFNDDGINDLLLGGAAANGGTGAAYVVFGQAAGGDLIASIDVKPGSDTNPVNLSSNGLISVAIFSSEDFDATQVDISTVQFSGALAAHEGHVEDVEGDGRDDLVLHFAVEDTELLDAYFALLAEDLADGELGSNRQEFDAILSGSLLDGTLFEGLDTVDLFLTGKSLREAVALL